MMTPTRTRKVGRQSDHGMTLIEIMVSIFLLLVISAVTTSVIINAFHSDTKLTASSAAQAQLNDAIDRTTRDISVANPLLYTSTTAGWPTNSPSSTELWMQTVQAGKCVRTHYWVDSTVSTNQKFDSATYIYPTSTCPAPAAYDTSVTPVTKTIITNLQTTSPAGVPIPVFSYFDRTNTALSNIPLSQSDTNKIARVQVNVGANVPGRTNGVRMITSIALQTLTGTTLSTGANPPACPDTSNLYQPSSTSVLATWSWTGTPVPNGATMTLARNGLTVSTQTAATGTQSYSYTDTLPVSGQYQYVLSLSSSGGTNTCYLGGVGANVPSLTSPAPTVTVTPVTHNPGDWPSGVNASTVGITWPAVTNATNYQIWSRPLTIDSGCTCTPIGTGTYALVGTTTSTSWSQQPGWDKAYQYYVVAQNGTQTSAPSVAYSALTHTTPVTLTGTAAGYNDNHLSWTAATGLSANGYELFRQNALTTGAPWTLIATLGAGTTSYDDTSIALSTQYNYVVDATNKGPRGTAGVDTYISLPSNVVNVLQYPANPTTIAHGTENSNAYNPDGTNSASWGAIPTATSYTVEEFNNVTDTSPLATTASQTTLSMTDTGQPYGSRRFYMAVAHNATGASPNSQNPVLSDNTNSAYQRPAPPLIQDANGNTTSRLIAPLNNTNTKYSWQYVGDDDTGYSGQSFCGLPGNPGLCSYEWNDNASNWDPAWSATATTGESWGGGATTTVTVNSQVSEWGATDNNTLIACNKGGCSNNETYNALAYPGPFSVNPVSGNELVQKNMIHWYEPNFYGDYRASTYGGANNSIPTSQYPNAQTTQGAVDVSWTPSTGADPNSSSAYKRVTTLLDPSTDPFYPTANGGPCTSTCSTYGTSTSNFPATTTDGGWIGQIQAATYNYAVTATAPNGLARTASASDTAAPGRVAMSESTHWCAASDNNWAAAFKFYTGGYAQYQTTASPATKWETNLSSVVVNEFAGRMWNVTNPQDWVDADAAVASLSDSSPATWAANWVKQSGASDTTTPYTHYWINTSRGIGNGLTAPWGIAQANGTTTVTDGNQMIPENANVGAWYQVQLTAPNDGSTKYGHYYGPPSIDSEFTPTAAAQPSCSAGFGIEPGFVSRWVQIGSSYVGYPNTTNTTPSGFSYVGWAG